MHVDIGIRYFGKTDALGNEAVYTAFFVVAVPLVPIGCWYGTRRGISMGESFYGRPIRWHAKSLLLGYLRWLSPILPCIAVAIASPTLPRLTWDLNWVLLTILGILFYLALMFLFTKAPPVRARQRRLLFKVVHSTIDPAWLPAKECREVLDNLYPALEALGIPLDARTWFLRTPEPEIAPFVYALARYAAQSDPTGEWRTVADRIWTQIERTPAST